MWGDPATVDTVTAQLNSADGIVFMLSGQAGEENQARAFLRKYNIF